MRYYAHASAVGAALLLSASSLGAQATCTATNPSPAGNCTVTNTASATVTDIVWLQIGANTTDLGTPTLTDFNTGYRDAVGPVATVKANRAWNVSVVGAAATFTGTLGARAAKPSSDLNWDIVATGTAHNAGSAATLFSSASGTSGTNQAVFYRTNWVFASDTPGHYSLVVNYTLSAP